MKRIVPLMFAIVQLVTACAGPPEDEADTQTHAAAPTTDYTHSYLCESGEAIAATYPTSDSATIQYKSSQYDMQIAVSGSGARYVNDDLEWWTKSSGPGSEGMLFRHPANGTSGERIEICNEETTKPVL